MDQLASKIREEIGRNGSISFARFMELALYAPGLGYYERQREIGKCGDFFTSVSVGPLFGELLAFQFAQWLGRKDSFDRLQIVEVGAHDGALAADVLGWLQWWRPDLFGRLEYCLVEPSPLRGAWQEEKLRVWLPKIKRVADVADLGAEEASRVIFCNELLDAMPVHRLAWNAGAKKWDECCVACENEAFIWRRAAPPAELAGALPVIGPELAAVLPEGFVIEHSTSAVAWWKKTAEILRHGKLLTIDYGYTEKDRFRPERSEGTLRAFTHHHVSGDLLSNPGDNDLTAHVNFSAIEAVGMSAGLATEGLLEQGKFLTQILAQTQAAAEASEPWTPARTKQFQTLTHPDHLGHVFRVLIQSRAKEI